MKAGTLLARLCGVLLFLSLGAATTPRLLTLVTTARTLAPLSYEARREHQMGDWYRSIEALRTQLAPHEPIAVIRSPRDADSAVFANYYLYPIPTPLVGTRNDFRNSAADPGLPRTIVLVSANHAERTAYDVLRDRDLARGKRVVANPQLGEPSQTVVIPLVASLEGGTTGTYVTEATITNPNASSATLKATFWPRGLERTITLTAGGHTSYYDLVYQLFHVLDRGWMRIESSQPVRAAFYFANRGSGDSTLLPNATSPATRLSPATLRRDSKLFLVNPSDGRATAVVNGESIPLDPHAFVVKPIESIPEVEGDVYAFVTTRQLNGRTDFFWPAK